MFATDLVTGKVYNMRADERFESDEKAGKFMECRVTVSAANIMACHGDAFHFKASTWYSAL